MARGPEGKVGRVVHRVRGGDAPGEVRVAHDGMTHDYLAYSPQPVPVGMQVLVIHDRGCRQIDVEPWDIPAPGSPVAAETREGL